MRQDVASGGPGCSFSSAADRLSVRQFAVEHVQRGGMDPLAALEFNDGNATCGEGPTGNRSGIGGNAFHEFFNARRHTKKLLISPHQKLSDEQRHAIDADRDTVVVR